MNTQTQAKNRRNAIIIIIAFLALALFLGLRLGSRAKNSTFSGASTSTTAPNRDYIAIISVNGTIENVSSSFSTSAYYNHSATLDYIWELVKDDHNTGIFLYLDTPGGTVFETDELYLALMEYKAYTGRPIMAYMSHEACSGGYYAAMAADEIWANRNGITGSIGVVISVSDYSELYDKIGIKTDYIVSGVNKAMGAASKALTEEQRAIYQSIVDESYDQFVGIVCDGRGMSREAVLPLADGRIYTALQAKAVGLIDEIGTYEEAATAFSAQLGDCELYYQNLVEYSFLDNLLYNMNQLTPKTEAEMVQEMLANATDGTPFYLAQ